MCSVNTHHQNGKVERKIRHLQDLARSSIIQQLEIGQMLLTYSCGHMLCEAAEALNHIPHPTKTLSPIELFSNTNVSPNLAHKHTFGCPMYKLDHRLQSGHKISKWDART
jgi:hypothetical protein